MDDSTAAPKVAPRDGPVELIVLGGSEIERFPLRGGTIVIGRAADADIRIDAQSVSKRHARVHVSEREIEDLGSSNGTTVGTRKLGKGERARFAAGDVISLGDVSLVVRPLREETDKPPVSLPEGTMGAVWKLVDLAAPSELSILVLGETGVGKEIVAQAIHERSLRSKGPLLRLNCAAIPEQMLESELFGHEKGAFSGAHGKKIGLLESANGGTVVLDEVGELPLAMQAKILRALDAHEVLRLGALKPTPIDVRIVASTNRDLVAMTAAGTFRRDLYFRLDGLTIHVPPLRNRRSEIAELADLFVRDAARARNTDAPALATSAMRKLVNHDWPGNVRELKKVVERALVLANGETIEAKHLALNTPEAATTSPGELDLRAERDRAEKRAIQEALATCRGNQTRAAALLGISRRSLIERLDKYDLPRPRKT